MKIASTTTEESRTLGTLRRTAVPPFAALRAFEAVGRLGGIRKAAHSLALDNAVVSRHVRSLETWLGTPLFERVRGSRPSLTTAGKHYHARIAAAIREIAMATSEVTPCNVAKRIVIWSNGGFAAQWLSKQVTAFGATRKGLEIELRPIDQIPDLLQNEADIDIRYYGDSYSTRTDYIGVRHFEFARPPIMAVASPAFAAGMRRDCTVQDLLGAPLLHEEHDEQWRAWFIAHGVVPPTRIPGARLWHAHLAIAAAIRDQGVALASSYLVADEMAHGRLVEIVPSDVENGGVALGGYLFSARQDRWNLPIYRQLRHWVHKAASA